MFKKKKPFCCKPSNAFFSDTDSEETGTGNGISRLTLETAQRYLRAASFHIRAGGGKSAEQHRLTSKFGFYYFEAIIRNLFASPLVVVGRRCEYEEHGLCNQIHLPAETQTVLQ